MTQTWPPPPIKPFERLQVSDGLLIDTELWQLAHQYHHDRQNVHYQALHQPGIVFGLGVWPISRSQTERNPYKMGRGVAIQPGLAIDVHGNVIVVPQATSFRIATEVRSEPSQRPGTASAPLEPTKTQLVYLVVSYVDPSTLVALNGTDRVAETFRLGEKTTLPEPGEIELCRINVSSGEVILQTPNNVFEPQVNELDLRYRLQAQARPQAIAQLELVLIDAGADTTSEPDPEIDSDPPMGWEYANEQSLSQLRYLAQACQSLYPALQADETIQRQTISTPLTTPLRFSADLVVLHQGPSPLSKDDPLVPPLKMAMQQHLEMGGVILLEIATQAENTEPVAKIRQLCAIKQALQDKLSRIQAMNGRAPEAAELKPLLPQLADELKATTDALEQELLPWFDFLDVSLQAWEQLALQHPLRSQPFLFATPPMIQQQPTQIWCSGGVVIAIGDLTSAWGPHPRQTFPRDTIRTAQEFGINLLSFAWHRRHLTQLSTSV